MSSMRLENERLKAEIELVKAELDQLKQQAQSNGAAARAPEAGAPPARAAAEACPLQQRPSWDGSDHGLSKEQIARYSRQIILPSFGVHCERSCSLARSCSRPTPRHLPSAATYACPPPCHHLSHLQPRASCAADRCWWWARAAWGPRQRSTWQLRVWGGSASWTGTLWSCPTSTARSSTG